MSLFSPIAPNPVDGRMVDAGSQKGAQPRAVPHDGRPLEPPAQEIQDYILGRALVPNDPARERQHPRAMTLVQERQAFRSSLRQGAQQIVIALRPPS